MNQTVVSGVEENVVPVQGSKKRLVSIILVVLVFVCIVLISLLFLINKGPVSESISGESTINTVNESLLPQAQTDLQTFLSGSLRGLLMPETLTVTPDTITSPLIRKKDSFVSSWIFPDNTAVAAFISYANNKPNTQKVIVTLPQQPVITLTQQDAQQFVELYFTTIPKGEWSCKELASNNSVCFNSWKENGYTHEIGMVNPTVGKQQSAVFYCQAINDNDSCINTL